MSNYAIDIAGLKKRFKERSALDGLSLHVPEGSIFGFLGRNGAGKTTTIKILMGMLSADGGEASIFGVPVHKPNGSLRARRLIGFVPEDKELYPYMTVDQIITFTRPFFPAWRRDQEEHYRRMFDLRGQAKIPDLSKGMRSKLLLLLAVCRGAKLLILDEPTDGLDPAAIEDILRELVALCSRERITIFFSSHQLQEVEQIADHVAIIDEGRVVVADSLDDLKCRYRRLHVVLADGRPLPAGWVRNGEHVRQDGRSVSILARDNTEELVAEARSIPGASVEQYPVSLKEIFLEHVRRN